MPWITPVTDRTDGAYCTVTDMNRIAGNLDWLATELNTYQLYYGATVAKTTYVYNDYVSIADWQDILSVLKSIATALIPDDENEADEQTTYENFNMVESITLAIYEQLQLLLSQAANNHYAGDDIYTGQSAPIYAGGIAI